MSLSAGFFFSPQKLTFMEVGVHTGFKVMLQIYNFFDFIHLNNTVVFNISRKRVFLKGVDTFRVHNYEISLDNCIQSSPWLCKFI